MSDLLARLEQKLAEDEAWARGACQAYPYAVDQTLPAEGVSWEWVAGEDWAPVTPDPIADEFVAPAGYNCWLATKETWPDDRGESRRHTYTDQLIEMDSAAAGHIIRNDPKRVLRRIARDREVLGRHRPEPIRLPGEPGSRLRCFSCRADGPFLSDTDEIVGAAARARYDRLAIPAPWPCDEVLDLAEDYEVEVVV